MKHLVPFTFAGLLLALAPAAHGQQRLTGRVVDASTGQPVPYASISVLHTTTGTTSNAEGEFELKAALPGRLVVSELGHGRDTVAVAASSTATPLLVRLRPASVQLPEAQVGSYAAELFAQACRELRRTTTQKTYGQAFYRQVTKLDGEVTEVQEAMWQAKTSNAQVEGTALIQGRYAEKKALIAFKDFSLYTRASNFCNPAADSSSDDGIFSLKALSYLQLKVLRAGQEGPAQLIEIGFTSKNPASALRQGSVVINEATHQLLRLQFETTGFHTKSNNPLFKFREELTRLEWVFAPRPGGATVLKQLHVAAQATMSRPLKSDLAIRVASDTYFFDSQPTPAAGIAYAPAKAGQSDLATIKKTNYDPAFWRDNPVVKRTPLEDEAIRAFEQKGAFGTLLTP